MSYTRNVIKASNKLNNNIFITENRLMRKLILCFYIFIFFITGFSFPLTELIDDYKYINIENNFNANYYHHTATYGEKGNKEGQLYYPTGVAHDGYNRLYVAERENNRISVFEDGKFLFIIDAALKKPSDIQKIPGTERYLITDTGNYSFKIIFRDGKILAEYGGDVGIRGLNFSMISGSFIDDKYNIFLTDRLNDNIKVVDRYMNLYEEYNKSGREPGNLDQPFDIFVRADGDILITNYGNDRVEILDDKYRFKGYIGERGLNPTQFRGPAGIAGDNSENVYICDKYNGRVQKFDKNNIFMSEIGNGILKNPEFVTVDNAGKVYVSDSFFNKVFVFSPEMFILGKKKIIEEDYVQASKFFEYAIKIDNKNINAYYYLGYCYYKLLKISDFKEIVRKASVLDFESRAYELLKTLENKIKKTQTGRY
ncbi:MAG: NHL repeat-containing protein [Candidatus Muirbacterium halophilum]|nr:NHL repeat-containing protein [Candidatus Muirbacterium halophilum]MCK9475691.1 NHL repeat-containing protein [Candidatus Muirbacterium halophilum]